MWLHASYTEYSWQIFHEIMKFIICINMINMY